MSLIGLTGRKQAGKDTVGQYLVEKHGYSRMGFADKLKESGEALFGLPSGTLDKLKTYPYATVQVCVNKQPISGMDIRTFLQRYGTEAHREVMGEDIWVDILLPTHNAHLRNDKICITDVRFPNEARRVRDLGGVVVLINRPSIDADIHVSEQQLPDNLLDYEIQNDADLEKLYAAMDELLVEREQQHE